ncbi:synaptic vesicle glycoprotein 2B-like [Sitodiplosis mosellana]|uniref:synaptic vesicle glycoprotein 2B-like n=1 Tax=Sitodiplosis mosellana TaxID=263140 RepID=UPI002444EA8D|nr:synaptic vesicle glycoprotein 2B-like [Sitodiplosis mosellana]XP_055325561.1 synaptic vesicle glycoprotein 2B-like [Sitodiplosis mosellana]XP_055325643.1 synaptic vesicle glycoprotein 2B-like [Sitodiplosis mosellana]XP_055325710.1 synaptic vesicle glycoprotein 2B-like [Sitodiplosis mosellana]XP_055325788.1 synaptic vesicle glycoprotein 2B-like [Sitodiplosis mosellana]
MVDSDGESNLKDSNVSNSSQNSAKKTAAASVDTKPGNLHLNLNNQPPANSQIPGQFNYYEQHYRQLPEDSIDGNTTDQKHYASVYKNTSPRLSFDDGDDAKKYAVSKINGNGSCSENCEKFANISSITPIANANVARADFETAIELTGYGKFHYYLLAICGLVSTSEEMDVISMSFILPSAQCDLDLDTQTKGWLNSIIFIGMMVGAYVWGSIADTLGRRKVLIVISFMNALCIVASSFCQTYLVFMVFRFLNGVALGGSGPVIWSYFAEFQPKSRRGSMLSFMAAFWTIGNLFVAGLAWIIIPSGIGFDTPYFKYNSWRIFLLLCALPSFIVTALLFYLPESPKFLIMQGRRDKALNILRGIFVTNTGQTKDYYPVKELMIDEKFLMPVIVNTSNGGNDIKRSSDYDANGALCDIEAIKKKGKYSMMFSNIADNSRELFVPPILKFTIISILINFTFHIGYYGLMMWFPELFNRFDEFSRAHPGQSATVCQVTKYVVESGSHAQLGVCSSIISSTVFMESLISLSAALPANLISILFMDKLGRKFFLIFSTMSAAVCSAGMYFVMNKQQNFIVSAFFTGVIACGNASLDCLITEVFPTHLRATGVAISMISARLGGIIGNIVIAQLLDLYCPAPTFIVAVLLAGGGLMCLMLPNTTRTALS